MAWLHGLLTMVNDNIIWYRHGIPWYIILYECPLSALVYFTPTNIMMHHDNNLDSRSSYHILYKGHAIIPHGL